MGMSWSPQLLPCRCRQPWQHLAPLSPPEQHRPQSRRPAPPPPPSPPPPSPQPSSHVAAPLPCPTRPSQRHGPHPPAMRRSLHTLHLSHPLLPRRRPRRRPSSRLPRPATQAEAVAGQPSPPPLRHPRLPSLRLPPPSAPPVPMQALERPPHSVPGWPHAPHAPRTPLPMRQDVQAERSSTGACPIRGAATARAALGSRR
mmetsp:Transcript_16953/g.54360  ORF Transcript_16953/g.54360 Transcript_16953/m.54360 type:complete len:200 (+) Transcript_16953:68-667(+)